MVWRGKKGGVGGEGVNQINLACVRSRRFGENTPHCYNRTH